MVPPTLYKLGKIHYINGNKSLALKELSLLINSYPTAELFDKTCKTLADIYETNSNYRKSYEMLDRIKYIDLLYSKEEIDKKKAELKDKEPTL